MNLIGTPSDPIKCQIQGSSEFYRASLVDSDPRKTPASQAFRQVIVARNLNKMLEIHAIISNKAHSILTAQEPRCRSSLCFRNPIAQPKMPKYSTHSTAWYHEAASTVRVAPPLVLPDPQTLLHRQKGQSLAAAIDSSSSEWEWPRSPEVGGPPHTNEIPDAAQSRPLATGCADGKVGSAFS